MTRRADSQQGQERQQQSQAQAQAQERLAQRIALALALAPPPRAPASLEARVLTQIQRRAGRPWWRRGVTQWPPAVRAGFLAVACGLAAGLLLSPRPAGHGLPPVRLPPQLQSLLSTLLPHPPRMPAALATAAALGRTGAVLVDSIPAQWLHGGLALAAIFYTALFALLAAACRLLGLRPFPLRE